MNSTNRMTKYEKARILGTRAMQISASSPILVPIGNETDSLRIAQMELRARKIPYIIKRTLPNGIVENWNVEDMIIP